MKLKELLKVLAKDDYIGLWNIECDPTKKHKSRIRFEERPTQQQYMKVGNIPLGRIINFLDKDIYGINHTEKGYLVRFGDFERVNQSLNNHDLAFKIGKAIKGE